MKLSKISILTSLAILGPLAALAEDGKHIEHVLVTEEKTTDDTTSSFKTSELLINVPQSLSVVTSEQIVEQGFQSLADVIQYTPGATIGQGEGHRDQITIRGQNTTADFFIDGLRDDVQYFRPLYNLERVEVLRGANALIFGRGGGGGVINRVTKKPIHDEQFNDLSASVDSFGAYFFTLDSNIDIGDDQGLRINGFYESLNNHRDFFDGERFAFNPTFSKQLTDDTSIFLSYEHVYDDRVVDRGVPAFSNGRPATGFRDTFFGDPNFNQSDFEGNVFTARVDHLISSDWTVNATLLYGDYDKLYQNLFADGFNEVSNELTLDGYIDTTDRKNLLGQVNLIGEVETGALRHTLLLGVEYGQQDTLNTRRDSLFAASNDDQITFPFSNPLAIPAVSFPELNRDRDSEVSFQSFFVQDQVDIGEHFIVVGGARYDRFDIGVTDFAALRNGNDGLLGRIDEEISPRLGLIFKPQEHLSFYASYTKSFLPRSGDQFLTLTLDQEALGPEEFTNMEVGFKWDMTKSLSLNAALFDLERDSGTTIDPDDPGNTILISSETQGLELQLNGNITDQWSMILGYSYLDAKEDGRVVNGVSENRNLAQVPENMFSVWNRYDVNNKLGFGAGVIYQSEQFATIGNAVELPSFTRVDAAVFYALDRDTNVQLNIENVFDREYFPTAHSDDNITTGEPLNARITVSRRF